MQAQSTRRSILINTLWGKANVLVRYLTSFAATAIIAANYSPEQFGFYQLILTYLGILESINLLNPTHLRNHLVKNPNDESIVASVWYYQSIGLWVISSLILLGAALSLSEPFFWWLLLLGNIRVLFKAYEYMQVIADYRLRNDLTQKIQMMMLGSFNSFRIVFALLRLDLVILVSCSIIQGVLSGIYQTILREKVGFKFHRQFSWSKYKQLVFEGAWLSVVFFFTTIQTRLVSAIVAEKMSPALYGNFQLVIKLVEPATAIGAIVFGANYTVLAHTLKNDRALFPKRFLKISILSLGIAIVCGLIICFFPPQLLIRIFGEAYRQGLSILWIGAGVIVANAILNVSIQYDMLLVRYRLVVLKYSLIFVLYVVLFGFALDIDLPKAVLLQCAVPIGVVAFVDLVRWANLNRPDKFKPEVS